MAKQTKEQKAAKALDKAIEKAWYEHGNGVQVDIMSIPKIFRECALAVNNGATVDDAVKAAVAKFRLN